MTDVTLASFEEMEPIYEGLARRARATLGVTAWGMQLFTLPPNWDGYPDHVHDATVEDANQEEVYIPLHARLAARRRRRAAGDDAARLAGDRPVRLAYDGERLAGITGFPQPELFAALGLPDALPPDGLRAAQHTG